MDPKEARELVDRIKKKLAQSPLPVAEHKRRNIIGAFGAVLSALVPFLLLELGVLPGLFVQPQQMGGAHFASFFSGFLALFEDIGKYLSFAEIRVLGWIALPGLFVWYGLALDRATDGKLDSTEAREIEHLRHEADAAKQSIGKVNQTPEEIAKLSDTLTSLEPKIRLLKRVFIVHRHDLGWIRSWPWIAAVVLLLCAWFVIGQCDINSVTKRCELQGPLNWLDVSKWLDLSKWRALWPKLGGPIFGGLFVAYAAVQKLKTGWQMQAGWSYVDFIRAAVRDAGESKI